MKGVLLDLDDTLLDHGAAVESALSGWLPTLGVTAEIRHFELWHDLAEKHLAVWRTRSITFAEQRRRRLREFLPSIGVPFEESALDEIFKGFLLRYESSYRCFDDVDELLRASAAAGLVTAVLTNGSTRQQNDKIRRVGLAGRIGPVYTLEDLGVGKPDPAAFTRACERWGLAPSDVVSVGDRHDLDVLPARVAGLRAVHLDRRGVGPLDEPARITSLRDLPAFL